MSSARPRAALCVVTADAMRWLEHLSQWVGGNLLIEMPHGRLARRSGAGGWAFRAGRLPTAQRVFHDEFIVVCALQQLWWLCTGVLSGLAPHVAPQTSCMRSGQGRLIERAGCLYALEAAALEIVEAEGLLARVHIGAQVPYSFLTSGSAIEGSWAKLG